MSDPFIDPLDTAPILRPTPSVKPQESGTATDFAGILAQKMRQEPSPILTPESLNHRPNADLFRTMPTAVPAEVPQNTTQETNPQNSGIQTYSQKPEMNPFHNRAVNTGSSLTSLGKEPVEASPYPANLRELLGAPASPPEASQPPAVELPKTPPPPAGDPLQKNPTPAVKSDSSLSPKYKVKRGDTLSHIVARALKEKGDSFTRKDVYRLVQVVADKNGITNPNRIRIGQTVDLSPIRSKEPARPQESSSKTAQLEELQAPAHGPIISRFGMRNHPIFNEERFHNGIDIAMDIGTPVHPVKAGVVSFSGEISGYGRVVDVDHGNGTITRYAHLSERRVKAGDQVHTDTLLGASGETGLTTGPHLHFEVRHQGQAIDPLTVMAPESIEKPPAAPVPVQLARDTKPKSPA